jgi:hypothetical protein
MGEDRRIVLCPRAIAVLRRQLALRATLLRAGKIDHDYLFFKASGAPMRNLQYPGTRWRQSLSRLRAVRYRRPYCARHTSVSWDLMTGRSALWVARQHGHSIATMLRFYAAWAAGALEPEIATIRSAMNEERSAHRQITPGAPSQEIDGCAQTVRDRILEALWGRDTVICHWICQCSGASAD